MRTKGSVGSAVSTAVRRGPNGAAGMADKAMAQRRRRTRPGPEGPGARERDANSGS